MTGLGKRKIIGDRKLWVDYDNSQPLKTLRRTCATISKWLLALRLESLDRLWLGISGWLDRNR